MANTTFKLRRSSVAGKSPNTSTLSIGELAINLTDRKLYSSDGTNIFETGSNLTSLAVFSSIVIGNSTVNNTVNSTAFSGTSNNATNLGGTAASSYQLNSTLAANVATLTANLASYIVANTGIVSNATGVFVNSAYINTISSNLAYYVPANTGIVSNSTGVFVNSAYINTISSNNSSYLGGLAASNYANTSAPLITTSVTVGNSTVNATINSTSFSGTSSNATNLNSQPGSYYTNATNITTGTLPYAQLGTNVVNTTSNFTITGIHTHSANIVVGNSTINATMFANSTNVYFTGISSFSNLASYVVANNGITSNASGVFVTQGTGTVVNATGVFVNSAYINTISSNLAYYVPANTGIISNATGVFVNSAYINTISSNLAYYVIANSGITSNSSGVFVTQGTGVVVNATGVHVNSAYINTISSNAAIFLTGNAITTNSTALIIANTAGVYANGSLGTSGQILTSNGSAIYWASGVIQTAKIYSKTTASAGQNTFTTSSAFTSGAIDVYVNGVHLANSDYTEVNTTTVQLAFNCTSGQIVEISGYAPQSVVGNVNFTAAVNSFTGDGATTAFGLTTANVSTQSAFVFINGILQNPSNAYSISANVITFTSAPSNNDLVEVRIPQLVNANTSTTNVTAVVGNNTVQFTNTAYMVSNNQTVNAISQTVIDSYDATLYRTAKYLVQVTDNVSNNYQCDEVMLTHDGATSYISVYGEIVTNTIIATFDTSYVSNNVRLLLTSTSANTTTKVLRTMLTV